jgi:hypothetical protein
MPESTCNCADTPPTMPTCRSEHLPSCPMYAYSVVAAVERAARERMAGESGEARAALAGEANAARLIRAVMEPPEWGHGPASLGPVAP